MAIELEVCADEKAAARRAAELITAVGAAAVAERDAFGAGDERRPQPLGDAGDPRRGRADALGGAELFQVDERIASPGSEDRNLTHMVLGLSMDHQATLRPMPVTQRDLEGAAREYESALPAPLDCVHLGIGPDGHTASLVPGDPVLEVSDRRVALTETAYQGHHRMTLTYPALAEARQIVWLDHRPRQGRRPGQADGRRHLDPRRPGRERADDRGRRRGCFATVSPDF